MIRKYSRHFRLWITNSNQSWAKGWSPKCYNRLKQMKKNLWFLTPMDRSSHAANILRENWALELATIFVNPQTGVWRRVKGGRKNYLLFQSYNQIPKSSSFILKCLQLLLNCGFTYAISNKQDNNYSRFKSFNKFMLQKKN